MSTHLEALRLQMEAAAEALNFEEAQRLRDEISLLRGRGDLQPAAPIDTSRLTRQKPGAMGLGTSDQKMKPPAGWTPPPRPDLMTREVKGRKHRR